MSSTFTPAQVADPSREKDWSANLGMLDWDSTRIVFTKRSLLEFLKYTGITVDTNFSNIQKLPKYAIFGKMTDVSSVPPAAQDPATAEEHGEQEMASPIPGVESFKPSRRVRTAPGGPSSDIFGHVENDGALARAPLQNPASDTPVSLSSIAPTQYESSSAGAKSSFKPSRRVREQPGGVDHISEIL